MDKNKSERGTEAPPDRPRRLALRVNEAARLLSVGRSTMYELIRSGEVPSLRIGKTLRVPIDSLEEWVARHTQEGQATHGTKDLR